LLLPKGHGACDVLRIEGPAAFRERMAKAVPVAQVLRA